MQEVDTVTTGHFGLLMPVNRQAERIIALNGVTDLDSQEEIEVLPPGGFGIIKSMYGILTSWYLLVYPHALL